jgi:hypothetical protein
MTTYVAMTGASCRCESTRLCQSQRPNSARARTTEAAHDRGGRGRYLHRDARDTFWAYHCWVPSPDVQTLSPLWPSEPPYRISSAGWSPALCGILRASSSCRAERDGRLSLSEGRPAPENRRSPASSARHTESLPGATPPSRCRSTVFTYRTTSFALADSLR